MGKELEIRKTAAYLRKVLPPLLPIRVYIRDNLEDEGVCQLNTKRGRPTSFSIYLKKHKAFQPMLDALMHEWAHALSWVDDECGEDHDAAWGIAHATVYRYLEGNDV